MFAIFLYGHVKRSIRIDLNEENHYFKSDIPKDK
jgi:hypothetical protein